MHVKYTFYSFGIFFAVAIMAEKIKFDLPCSKYIIFCDQDVLQKVQLAGLYKDSKTFVDMPLKLHVKNVSEVRSKILSASTKDQLRKVISEYFDAPGYREISDANLTDVKDNFNLLKKLRSVEYKQWTKQLSSKWQNLGRKVNRSVFDHKDYYTLIYLNETMVVPGGRFREIYYWDTYWVIDGLCLCEMYETAKSVLKNLLHFVKEYGFVPNGGRKYYLNRSQPPMLTLMMDIYYTYTKDDAFIKENIDTLRKEYEFWMQKRHIDVTVGDKTLKLARYNSMMGYPRPESFKEDLETIIKAGVENNEQEIKLLYSHIASAAESGWDFSSRWFGDKMNLKTIETRNIIPLDLNCILYRVETILSKFYKDFQNNKQAEHLDKASNERLKAIDELLWNKHVGMWQDYDFVKKQHVNKFYMSAFFPFWVFPITADTSKFDRAFKKLKDLGIFQHIGGIPTSLIESGQQWDFPNSWPPLQYVAVHGLKRFPGEMENTAKLTAQKYIKTAYTIWKKTGHMFEKYDVRSRSKPGHGGEYDVQEGFGWTNGVALNFLDNYGENWN